MLPGVRMACPDCSLDVVMTSEQACPPPVTKVVEGVPYCPNCDIPMAPVGSVDPEAVPSLGPIDTLDDHQRLGTIRQLERDVQAAEVSVARTKTAAKDAKDLFDSKVVTLRTAIQRLTATPAPAPPLIALSEQAEPATDDEPPAEALQGGDQAQCQATMDGVQCVGVTGHGGVHGRGDMAWEDDPEPVRQARRRHPKPELVRG